MTNTLFLRLEGPLQSWGERSQWGVRDSAPEPTKSGIVGLLGCALGWQRDDQLHDLSRHIHIAVRCDRPGTMLIDYHTVGGGANTPQLLTAEGQPKVSSGSPHTEQTWRHYLCDASFLVAVQTNSALITQLAEAVQNPCWPLFLGRKSCLPSLPVFEGIGEYATLAEALDRPWRSLDVNAPGTAVVRAVLESMPHEGIRRRHELISRSRRIFGPRYTKEVMLTIPVLPYEVSL